MLRRNQKQHGFLVTSPRKNHGAGGKPISMETLNL